MTTGARAATSHVRGEPGAAGQELLWSAGERARAAMAVVGADPGLSLVYDVTWTQRSAFVRWLRPPDHRGQISLAPTDGGTRVTWTLEPAWQGRGKLLRKTARLTSAVEGALDAIAAQAVDLPRRPQAPEDVVELRDAVIVWRGFTHMWTYNHRINRSGDWWTVPDCAEAGCAAEQVHAAASGSGADRAVFDGFGSRLTGPGIEGAYGSVSLWLDGKEGDQLADRACVTLPESVGDGPALLRGYDLDAVESADSLWELSLAVEREGDQVCAEARIRMDCDTPECGTETLTTYTMAVPFVVATGPDLVVQTAQVEHHQTWRARDLRDEPTPAEGERALEVEAAPDRAAAVGLSGFSIALDAPLHTRGVSVAVHPGGPGPDGALPVAMDLFYVQYGPVEIAPLTVAQFAHAGEAEWTADLVVVQPSEGCVVDAQTAGTTFWPGKQADASGPTAEHRAEVTFDPRCAAE